MKTIPVAGKSPVTFFEDDSIEVVRQHVALSYNSHPDRLFIQVKASLPADYYASNPKHWTDLFLRMSYDGKTLKADVFKTYLTQVRLATGVTGRDLSLEEWEDHPEDLKPLFDPEVDFEEWRILGVEDIRSFVMPIPPKELPELKAANIPISKTQSLYETLHPYDVSEIRALEVTKDLSQMVLNQYFPGFRKDTPENIESLRPTILGAQKQLQNLLALKAPEPSEPAILRAKWYVPLIETRFTAPRTRFEQVFYGLTVSPETPYIGYFTAKSEVMRHKFYVEDTLTKKLPEDFKTMWKGWIYTTRPQRRTPTLLLYRGTSRANFDRISLTPKDITISTFRDKESGENLETLQANTLAWLKTLDALVPFLATSDLEPTRWKLDELSVLADYKEDITEFDMRRFPCLQTIFGFQKDTFRLLRADHASDDVSPLELQAYQVLNQEGVTPSAALLQEEMDIPANEAETLYRRILSLGEDFDIEKTVKGYPVIKFSNREVILKFVTNLERTLKYANVLRYVLTSDASEVDVVCPRRMEKVEARAVVPQREIDVEGEFNPDDDLLAELGYVEEEAAPEPAVATEEEKPKSRKVKVEAKAPGTYNYFNNRVQKFDPDTFDKDIYPKKCEKLSQVVVLTPEDQARLGDTYNYSSAPENQKLPLEDPDGIAICPAYWCMRDELPLTEEQLVPGDDGELHCPKCKGKVRKSDSDPVPEFTVIKRDIASKYPKYISKIKSSINKRKIPCCYLQPRAVSEVLVQKEDETYVLSATNIPALRLAFIPEDLAAKLKIGTRYETTVKKGRLVSEETDIFRVGLGRASKTLPVLLKDSTVIPRPSSPAGKTNLLRCSFFRTWTKTGEGETQVDRIVSSIDAAYELGDLTPQEELEYVSSFLRCEVIRVDPENAQVLCGFWSDNATPFTRTLVVMGNEVVAQATRKKEKKTYKMEFQADIRKKPFTKDSLTLLRNLHREACSTNLPSFADGVAELQAKGKGDFEVILDPFSRIQALLVPKEVLLPVQPSGARRPMANPARSGYSDIKPDELPSLADQRAFLKDTKHPGFKEAGPLENINGMIVELLLKSGFRAPVVPEEGTGAKPREIVETVDLHNEKDLVYAAPNVDDAASARKTAYQSEIFEFLMYSLSKDIQTEEYSWLRSSIQRKSDKLYKRLSTWFKEEAYQDVESPVKFINKVRTPCGQFTDDPDSCKKSTLCGMYKNTCRIRVNPIVKKEDVLKRMVKTLRNNEKQRALVLDERLSPFFSTILYLEMPHELITTSV